MCESCFLEAVPVKQRLQMELHHSHFTFPLLSPNPIILKLHIGSQHFVLLWNKFLSYQTNGVLCKSVCIDVSFSLLQPLYTRQQPWDIPVMHNAQRLWDVWLVPLEPLFKNLSGIGPLARLQVQDPQQDPSPHRRGQRVSSPGGERGL